MSNLPARRQPERPLWLQILLWALLILFAGLLLRELGNLFRGWQARNRLPG